MDISGKVGISTGPSPAWGFVGVLKLQLLSPSLRLSQEVPPGETTYPVSEGPCRHSDEFLGSRVG